MKTLIVLLNELKYIITGIIIFIHVITMLHCLIFLNTYFTSIGIVFTIVLLRVMGKCYMDITILEDKLFESKNFIVSKSTLAR